MKARDMMKKVPAAAGIVGILCLIAGLGTYLVTNDFDQKVGILLAFGAALILVALMYYPQEFIAAFKSRYTRYGSNTLVMIAIFVAIVAMLNFLSARRSFHWDLTEGHQHSLSPQTMSLLAKLEEPVKITAFYSQGEGSGREEIEDLLKDYRRYSDKIDYQFVDPVLTLSVARQYQIQNYGTTVIEYRGKRQDVMGASEQDLTSGLLKLTRGKALRVYFLTGHGEANIEESDQGGASLLKAALLADNYDVDKLTLATAGSVPDDAGALVIAGSKSPFLESEKTAIKSYLDNGGKAMVMREALGPDSLDDILKQWGVEVGEGVVIDTGSSLPNQPQMPVVVRYAPSPITEALVRDSRMTLFPLATSVTPSKESPKSVTVSTLMETTDRSWLETDLTTARYDEGVDVRGPFSLAVAVEGDASAATQPKEGTDESGRPSGDSSNERKAKTRLVVIGDADFAGNDLVGEPAIGNRDLFLNSVGWLTEQEDLISIRANQPADRSIFLTGTQMNFVLYTSVIFLPMAVLAIGGLVWWNRR